MLYNGRKPYPDETILKLSELFRKPEELGIKEKDYPLLELEVKVLNINEGKNEDMVKRCRKLSEYSAFIARVYKYLEETNDIEKAIEEAIKYCQKHDILKEFLEIHGSEVLNMLLEEWNIDDAREVWQEEAREEGLEEGREQGREEGLEEGHKKGCEEASLQIARNLLSKGSTHDFVHDVTGLDLEIINKLNT